jgi:hypothetical protein
MSDELRVLDKILLWHLIAVLKLSEGTFSHITIGFPRLYYY